MNANGITIFSVRSFSNLLIGGSLLLVGLLVIVKPEASLGLGPLQRTLYWSLHVSTGLAAMYIASQLIRRSWLNPLSLWSSVLLCGIMGTLLITPFYLLIDHIWPNGEAVEIDDWLDRLHQTGLGGSLLAEFLEVLPWTMTAWLMLNQPLLSGLWNSRTADSELSLDNSVQALLPDQAKDTAPDPEATSPTQLSLVTDHADNTGHSKDAAEVAANVTLPRRAAQRFAEAQDNQDTGSTSHHSSRSDGTTPVQVALVEPASRPQQTSVQPEPTRFLQSLPGIFGKDIIAISSDLHYLQVFTLVGKTTVLGNLRDVTAELGDAGLQVHRSHWVAHSHVERIVNTGGQAACIMSNGIRVPVSRRRWKTVRDYYGKGVIVRNQ